MTEPVEFRQILPIDHPYRKRGTDIGLFRVFSCAPCSIWSMIRNAESKTRTKTLQYTSTHGDRKKLFSLVRHLLFVVVATTALGCVVPPNNHLPWGFSSTYKQVLRNQPTRGLVEVPLPLSEAAPTIQSPAQSTPAPAESDGQTSNRPSKIQQVNYPVIREPLLGW